MVIQDISCFFVGIIAIILNANPILVASLFVLACLIGVLFVVANIANDFDRLKSLIEKGQVAQAYDALTTYLSLRFTPTDTIQLRVQQIEMMIYLGEFQKAQETIQELEATHQYVIKRIPYLTYYSHLNQCLLYALALRFESFRNAYIELEIFMNSLSDEIQKRVLVHHQEKHALLQYINRLFGFSDVTGLDGLHHLNEETKVPLIRCLALFFLINHYEINHIKQKEYMDSLKNQSGTLFFMNPSYTF